MRVVAGTLGGRKLSGVPKDLESVIRPTTDRVREAMFNSLMSLDAIDGASVVDVFAGTGACGIEALSRGASQVTFVDASRKACDLIRQNLDSVAMSGTVVCSDAVRWASDAAEFDVAIVDPPYGWDEWPQLLDAISARLVICEAPREVAVRDGWNLVRARRYGQTVTTLLEASQ